MLDKSPASKIFDPTYEELRPNSHWKSLLGIDVRHFFRFVEIRDTGSWQRSRMTRFYCVQANFLFGLPEDPTTTQLFWETLWKQRKHKALSYFSSKPTVYARSFEQILSFVPNEDLRAFTEALRKNAGIEKDAPELELLKSPDATLWYYPDERILNEAANNPAQRCFLDNRHLVERFLEDIHGKPDPEATWRSISPEDQPPFNYAHSKFSENALGINWACENKREIFFSLCPSFFLHGNPYEGSEDAWMRGQPRSFMMDIDQKYATVNDKGLILDGIESLCQDLSIPYTHKIETRNGFHIYWTLKDPIGDREWKRGQRRLIEVFKDLGADIRITSLGHCPRLPFTNHWKDNPDPFRLDLVFMEVPKYSLEDFFRKINVGPEDEEAASTMTSYVPRSIKPIKEQPNLEHLMLAKQSFKEYGKELFKAIKDATSDLDLLCDFVGVQTSKHGCFRCCFHNDKKPSARIFKDSTGNWRFVCFKCEIKGDILTLLEDQKGYEKKDAILELMELSGRRDLVDFKPKVDLAYLDENLKLLNNFESVPESYNYPTLSSYYNHPTIKPFLPFLADCIELAKKKILSFDGSFPASLKEFAITTKSPTQATNKLYLSRLAELIQSAPVPQALVSRQREFKGKHAFKNDTSWHLIPIWTPDLLEKAFKTLIEAHDAGITTKNCTRGQIEHVYGIEAGQRVYHSRSTLGRQPSNIRISNFEMDEYIVRQAWYKNLSNEELDNHLIETTGRGLEMG